MKDKIEEVLGQVDRPGVAALAEFLCSSDFYTAPCSTKFHLAVPGGLAQHTWNVIQCAKDINKRHGFPCHRESVILSALGHDLCKVNFYVEVSEPPTEPQMKYLQSLLSKNKLVLPLRLNKAYVGVLIDFLLHQYKPGDSLPGFVHQYIVNDVLPLGHGEKSLFIMQNLVTLTTEEALAIRFHMGAYDFGVQFSPLSYSYKAAQKQSALVSILQLADIEATFLVEV